MVMDLRTSYGSDDAEGDRGVDVGVVAPLFPFGGGIIYHFHYLERST